MHRENQASLCEAQMDPDPINQFKRWFAQAKQAQLPYPHAMTLATVDAHHQPSARIVLMKHVDAHGFVFYTNYQSRKAQELMHHPRASLVFHWAALDRQVRVEGLICKTSDAESNRYFHTRPLASKIGAWVSQQSTVMHDRAAFEARYTQLAQQLGDQPPRPPYWGGYRLDPHAFEFWQGQPARLHDRIQYVREAYSETHGHSNRWRMHRLCP